MAIEGVHNINESGFYTVSILTVGQQPKFRPNNRDGHLVKSCTDIIVKRE